jgi:hypothetical protein
MKKVSISATEAGRNFADCVNRAHHQGVTFVLLRYGAPVAQIAPNVDKVCNGRDLAALLARTNLADSEAKAWRRDLVASGKALNDAYSPGAEAWNS